MLRRAVQLRLVDVKKLENHRLRWKGPKSNRFWVGAFVFFFAIAEMKSLTVTS